MLVGRLTDGAGGEALRDDVADGNGLIEGEGVGVQAASRAHSREIANAIIVTCIRCACPIGYARTASARRSTCHLETGASGRKACVNDPRPNAPCS